MITRIGEIKNRVIAGAKTKKGSVGRLNKIFFQKFFFFLQVGSFHKPQLLTKSNLKE